MVLKKSKMISGGSIDVVVDDVFIKNRNLQKPNFGSDSDVTMDQAKKFRAGKVKELSSAAVIAYAESLDRKITRLAKFDNHFNKAQMPGERASALLNWRKTIVKLKPNELVWMFDVAAPRAIGFIDGSG